MNISRQLPQFTNERALVVVCSTHEAQLFSARNGRIIELQTVIQAERQYSDREGHFQRSGRGISAQSGSVYESDAQARAKRFASKLKKAVDQEYKKNSYTTVYIGAPDRYMKLFWRSLPAVVQKDIVMRLYGNYYGEKISRVLRAIKEKQKKRAARLVVRPHSAEAQKLLQNK